mmetsp:Transcript_25360/g.58985  ORF Transcript_25360/g.58985 Transcript_25360/m.58985 type:complete len:231 (-) Transcript_25360:242-934(-)|eukprot:CAMPEP_0116845274 /NCGR_PEP_ID=MMETSP0418-20121206/13170_1 /TAXON_ID=1158023 /ORGANISM="Astrosyne radiata, Strain 13vi08-1A" /LENGTH=230 /DNA_ID=CAMNT_0004476355 /DNA_START=52 /DNA_END=744 /DNA_ORIENTATION=-
MSARHVPLVVSFVAGVTVASLFSYFSRSRRKDRENAGAVAEGNDLSLFYGDKNELKTVTESRKFLPGDLYGRMVRDCVVCCVDCLVVRFNPQLQRKECLVVLRASEPVKGVWWLPGGRLFKGETFFDAARRKARQETGLDDVKCVQVLGVWNTFFPTSHWDTETEKGTQTVNPVVLVELEKPGADVVLDETSEKYRWIGLDPDGALANNEDKYVLQALKRLHAWNPSYNS